MDLTEQHHVDLDGLSANLELLLNNQETADVVFVIGPDEMVFCAHKLILWTRCSSFQDYRQQFWRNRSVNAPLTYKYPNYKPEVFAQLLNYIYTGKIILSGRSILNLLEMCVDLGMEKLRRQCITYVQSSMCAANACHFLSAALALQEASTIADSNNEPNFVDTCVSFIEQHAEECVQSEGWLNLPKPTVIKLISTHQFALEEDKVWKAVLSWAKYNAGVPMEKKPKSWNDNEKKSVHKALDGLVDHVKLLLIDSRVFAEEVEPTGIVPMEVSLERYRFAAVPGKLEDQSEDERLRPRVTLRLFGESTILSEEKMQFQSLLNQWYGRPKQTWRLLYRASRDGFTAEDFHRFCDGHAPSYVIVKGCTDSVCGGFSDVAWTSNTSPRGRYIPSHRSFVFTLVNKQDVPPTKFEITNPKLATLHHPNYGPIFGAGADLCIANKADAGMECYSNLPHSYGGDQASSSILMGDYSFNVMDYEVFTPLSLEE